MRFTDHFQEHAACILSQAITYQVYLGLRLTRIIGSLACVLFYVPISYRIFSVIVYPSNQIIIPFWERLARLSCCLHGDVSESSSYPHDSYRNPRNSQHHLSVRCAGYYSALQPLNAVFRFLSDEYEQGKGIFDLNIDVVFCLSFFDHVHFYV